ncbi:DUF4194 domain-containing protein [Arthrobacter sp. TMN-49]
MSINYTPTPLGRQTDTANTERALFAGDTGSFPLELRQALVRLLRGPYIDGTVDPALWTTILSHAVSLQQYLSEIFLLLSVDADRKIALLTPVPMDAVHTQPIVARKPLRREETLLALRLRVLLDRHAGSGTDVTVSRSSARDILAEHRQPGTLDDKRLDEQTDAALARLMGLKLILPTELPGEYRVSNALALALPFDSIEQIPAYLAALDKSAANDPAEPHGHDELLQEIS